MLILALIQITDLHLLSIWWLPCHMLFTDILEVFEYAYFFLYSVNIYIICQLKGCLFIIMTIIPYVYL